MGCNGCINEYDCDGQCGDEIKAGLVKTLMKQRSLAMEELKETPWIRKEDLLLIKEIAQHSEMIGRLQAR